MRNYTLIAATLLLIAPCNLLADNSLLAENPSTSSDSSVSDSDYNLYSFAMQDYYKVPVKDISAIKERGISTEELPVVLFFVKNAKVTIDQVLEHRLKGEKWVSIAEALDIKPAMVFVPVKEEVKEAHFARAYGYFKTKQLKSWKWVNLEDEDFANLVNLKFLARHYDVPAYDIIKQRETGVSYMAMNVELNDRKFRAHNEKELKSAWKR